MIRCSPRALALCLVIGCGGGELASDYTLNLVPHTLTGQEPFQDGRHVELVVIAPDGSSAVYSAGDISGSELTLEELPPVAAESQIGLLIEAPGGVAGELDLELAEAWGNATVYEPLAAAGNEVTVDILVAEIGTIGDMGTLPAAKTAIGAGVAMVPGGDVYIIGGAASSLTAEVSDKIQWMTATDSGTWNFERVSDTLPDIGDGVTGRFGLAASVVEVGGSPQIFISGGRAQPGNLPGTPTYGAFLFDPITQELTWGKKDNHDRMHIARSEHGHVVMDNGNVLLYGGFTSALGIPSLEVFNPKKKRFEDLISSTSHGDAYPAAASLGPGGAIVCGGGDLDNPPGFTSPVDGCDILTLGGVITAGNRMPDPVLGHAMARLADGRILATGGILDTVGDNFTVPATDQAWIYSGNNWSRLAGKMKTARAHHQIIPTPDGNAIILGGSENGGAIFPNPSPAVVCAELFDAKSQTFQELAPCSGAGGGVFPGWSKLDTEGAFVLAGWDGLNSTPAGDAFGFIAFPPAL